SEAALIVSNSHRRAQPTEKPIRSICYPTMLTPSAEPDLKKLSLGLVHFPAHRLDRWNRSKPTPLPGSAACELRSHKRRHMVRSLIAELGHGKGRGVFD